MAHQELPTAAPLIPARLTLPRLRLAASRCTACDLYKTGIQTVFGEGLDTARAIFVGEQPGDIEDRVGRPFVGPAGKLLDRALGLHEKPNAREIAACRPWLEAELEVIKPQVLVCLGATAAQALLGKSFRVTKMRGEILFSDLAEKVMATVHPSSILRSRRRDAPPRDAALRARPEPHCSIVGHLTKMGAPRAGEKPRGSYIYLHRKVRACVE
jgi:DNA polymerase